MNKLKGKQLIIIMAAAILLISIFLMAIIIPIVYTETLPNEYNTGAVIGIVLAILIRLLILFWYISIIKKIRRDTEKGKKVYVIIGVLLVIFGLIYLDGAFAFFDHKNILYLSYLMFTSVVFDLIASILTFIAAFYSSQKIK